MLKKMLLIGAPAVLLLAGCASEKLPEKTPEKQEQGVICRPEALQESELENMRKTARMQGETMLRAMQAKDYEAFTQFFPPEIKAKFPKSSFDRFDEYIGTLEKWEYLTEMNSPMVMEHLWKTTIRRKDASGKEIRLNILFHLSAVKQNGQYQLVGSYFR